MADISPELAAKIHDLEDRHNENPGRYFVALASALREAGEVGQAEELLRSGLKRHPGSLSAHIVLGRCLADRGAVDEATNEFRYVLSVDPQNLIALRTLGEMSAAAGRGDEAARWYRELLAVDPMNKEARDALDALASAPAPRPGAPAADVPGAGGFGAGDYGMVELSASTELPGAPGGGEFGMVEPADAGFEIRALDDDRSAAHGQGGTEDALGIGSSSGDDRFGMEPPLASTGDAGEFGLVELEPSAGFAADEAPAARDDAPAEFGAWGEISLEPSEAAPSAADDTPERAGEYDGFSFGDVPLGSGLEPAAESQPVAEPGQEPAVPLLHFGDADTDDAAGAGDDEVEVVTETMAELYARQGFHDRAAEVYRELMRRRGEEPGLVGRLAEVERLARGEEPAPAAEPWHTVDDELRAPGTDESDDGALPLLETGLPGLGLPISPELPAYEPEPAPAFDAAAPFGAPAGYDAPTPFEAAEAGSAAPAAVGAAPSPTGDAFADSFAWGFAGAPAAGDAAMVPAGDSAAAVIEATAAPADAAEAAAEPAPELISGIVDQPYGADTVGASHADDPLPLRGTAAAPSAAAPAAAWQDDFAADAFRGEAAEPAAAHEPVVITDDGEVELPPAAAAAAAPAPTTVSAYLSSLLAWRPGMGVASFSTAATAFPTADMAQGEELSADDGLSSAATLDAPVGAADAAPAAEPWGAAAADSPAGEFATDAASEEFAGADASAGEPAAEPWAAFDDAAAGREPVAGRADAEAAGTDDEDLPWIGSLEAEPAAAPAEEPAPWDAPWETPAAPAAPAPADFGGFQIEETLAPEPAAEADAAPAAAGDGLYPWEFASDAAPSAAAPPAQPEAPAAPAGGFSFEDFFAEPAAPAPAPPPAPAPLPEPPAAAAPGAPAGGDDDEDLESFQAWLQSLKR